MKRTFLLLVISIVVTPAFVGAQVPYKRIVNTASEPGNWLTYVREQKQSVSDNGFQSSPINKDDSDTSPILSFQTAAKD